MKKEVMDTVGGAEAPKESAMLKKE